MDLDRQALAIFNHALRAVDPRLAVQKAIPRLNIPSGNIYAIAIGKAATSMALGLEDALNEQLSAGVLVSPSPIESKCWQTFAGGHPLPDEASLAAAQAAFALIDRANDEHATIIFLISGGGSAMIEWPVSDEISLTNLRSANQTLISCGAHIAEVNAVRRAFSAVKGGALARRAPLARIFTLIVSDTNPGDEASVASGPSLSPPRHAPAAIDVIIDYQLESVLPASIVRTVREAKESVGPVNGSHLVLLDNRTATEAARAKGLEFFPTSVRLDHISEQPIQQACDLLVRTLREQPLDASFCAVSGGEFSCPVRGDGLGGRNLETALRCAIGLDNQRDSHLVVLSAGTDGIDGNSPAAGAITNEITLERARSLGLNADDYLARSDSYTFFDRLNQLVVTGPTGTNVRDLRILLRSP